MPNQSTDRVLELFAKLNEEQKEAVLRVMTVLVDNTDDPDDGGDLVAAGEQGAH